MRVGGGRGSWPLTGSCGCWLSWKPQQPVLWVEGLWGVSGHLLGAALGSCSVGPLLPPLHWLIPPEPRHPLRGVGLPSQTSGRHPRLQDAGLGHWLLPRSPVQFSRSVVSNSLQPPWTAALQTSLPITSSWSLFKLMSTESVMPSNHLILCRPLLFLPSISPSIRVFSNELVVCIRWPKY